MERWLVKLVSGETVKVPLSYYRMAKNGDHIFDEYPNSRIYPIEIIAVFSQQSVQYVVRN